MLRLVQLYVLESRSGAAPSIQGSAQNRANLYAKRFRVGACWIGAGIDRYEDELEFPRWTSIHASSSPRRPGCAPRIRRGLLKGEQLHALARCVHYGRLGRLDQRDFERQTGAASCLLLILAAIIYWQIREIDRVLSEAGSDADDLNFELLSHISPIGWDNVLLYGASTSSTAVSCEAKGLAYKFARFWALPLNRLGDDDRNRWITHPGNSRLRPGWAGHRPRPS